MKNKNSIILFLILFIYAIIALLFAGKQGFWHDEIYTLTFMKGISAYNFEGSALFAINHEFQISYCKYLLGQDNFLLNFPIQILHEGHPPLYFLFLKVWSLCFGCTEVSLRGFSLFTGILSMIVLFSTFKENFKDKFTAWAILICLVFNPYLFYYFTEARMYSLAFLFATIVFKYWVRLKKSNYSLILDLFIFCLSATALLYTHYFGIFFIFTLFLIQLTKNGINKKLLYFIIPILLFLPWSFVVKSQLGFHDVHWTDGAFTFIDSFKGYVESLLSMFFSPMSQIRDFEALLGIFIIFVFYMWGYKLTHKLYLLSILFLYFIQIFLFDLIFDKHTIIVSRYYIFILIFIYWLISQGIKNINKTLLLVFLVTYCLIASTTIYEIYTSKRSQKQMYKELAYYIDIHHKPKNTIIVVEPKDAMIWGLAYYLEKDFRIVSANENKANQMNNDRKYIYIDEMLGFKFMENHLNNAEQQQKKLIPFVGLNLYE